MTTKCVATKMKLRTMKERKDKIMGAVQLYMWWPSGGQWLHTCVDWVCIYILQSVSFSANGVHSQLYYPMSTTTAVVMKQQRRESTTRRITCMHMTCKMNHMRLSLYYTCNDLYSNIRTRSLTNICTKNDAFDFITIMHNSKLHTLELNVCIYVCAAQTHVHTPI